MSHLDTLRALETEGFYKEYLVHRLRQELRVLSDAYTQQLLRFGQQVEEGEGVLYSIMVAQAYCIKRLLELNGKLELPKALERYAEIELENFATPESLTADRDFYRLNSLRTEAKEIKVGDQTFYMLYSPINQRTLDYRAIAAGSWMYSARRTLPRVVDFVNGGERLDNAPPKGK